MSGQVVVGVLITVPAPYNEILAGWREWCGDPHARQAPPHVTLLPPTEISEEELPKVEQHLLEAASTVGRFTMHLLGTGTFRPVSQVVFVQVAAGLVECELLEASIRRGPLQRELDFPYHPHVTVAQDVSPTALDDAYEGLRDFAARFPVVDFTMFARGTGGAWQPRRIFALSG
jgi:2'-5' RNA ligase